MCALYSSVSGQGAVAGLCQDCNEVLDCRKCRNYCFLLRGAMIPELSWLG